MQTLSEIRALLESRGLRPKHRFGQNFLHDKNQLARLVRAAEVSPGDLALEVGPGTGTLTETLLEAGAEVIACEIDRDLAALIRDRLGGRITLIEGDCLDGKHALNRALLDAINGRPFKLIANLPYQAASPLMMNLAVDTPHCRGQFVTIQREVADRLLASPGSKQYGPLGIVLQVTSELERLATLSPGCFWPAPQVTSAMIAIRPRKVPLVDDVRAFSAFVSRVFQQRRKQLRAILREVIEFPEGVDPTARPEQLSIEQLIELFQSAKPQAAGESN